MGHAILSASGAHRWMNCLPSARLEEGFEDKGSEAAAEGTTAHELAEHKLRKALKMRSKKPVSKYDCDEMDMHTDGYVGYVLETLAEAKKQCKDPIILIEQKLDFSCYVPDGFGTGDAVIIADGTLHIIDFKYGQGVLVDAKDNPQMKLYALGALALFESLYDVEEVAMTIYQPRRENVSTFCMTVLELKDWATWDLMPRAAMAFDGAGDFEPGEWCTFCKAAVKCRARAEAHMRLTSMEFALPPILADEEIEEIISSLDDLSKWANDIMAYATATAINEGKQWSGFKLVEGRSIRRFTDDEKVAETAKKAGYKDIYRQSLITLTEFEKLMGKETFKETLGAYVTKPPGKITLVPDSDKRQELQISSAQTDFMEE